MSRGACFSMVRFAVLPLAMLAMMLGASSASAQTSGGCFPPTFVASIYGSNIDVGFPYASYFDNVSLTESNRLKSQCKAFLKGCKQVSKQAFKCIQAGVTSIRSGQLTSCKDEPSSDVAACKNAAKDDAAEFIDLLQQDQKDAINICQGCYEDCLDGVTGSCGLAF